jgi:hypothetical protein
MPIPWCCRCARKCRRTRRRCISEDVLVESLPPRIKSEVQLLVRGLRARGFLEKAEDRTDSFWLSGGVLAPNASVRLSEASALVIGNGPRADSTASAFVHAASAR